MKTQESLSGKPLTQKPKLSTYCCVQCQRAKSKPEKCQCKCGGVFHGKGLKDNDNEDKWLPEETAEKYRAEMTRPICPGCGRVDLSSEPIRYYAPHPDGYTIPQEKDEVWLFIHCPVCNYESSLWKLGVNRE